MSDITEHNWGDYDIEAVYCEGDSLVLEFNDEIIELEIYELDTIAIAKHFYSQLKTKKEKNAFLDGITAVKDE